MRFEVYYARRTGIEIDSKFLKDNMFEFVLDELPGRYFILTRNDGSLDFDQNSCHYYSKMIGEAVYIGISENVNSFHYEHWKEDQLLRLLWYNSDYPWHRVEGTPEEWEKQVLFTEDGLKLALKCYDEEFHEKIREAWERKQIRQDDQFPSINEMDAYNDLESYLKDSSGTH